MIIFSDRYHGRLCRDQVDYMGGIPGKETSRVRACKDFPMLTSVPSLGLNPGSQVTPLYLSN